jgi:cyclopropane-fatty-acyl-phospholipid synthase
MGDPDPKTARRSRLADAIVDRIRQTIDDDAGLTIELDHGRARIEDPDGRSWPGRATVVVLGSDAVARLLFPPTADALAEGYLRGDLDIVGDVGAAVTAGQRFDLRRLGPADLRQLVRWGLELRTGTPPAKPLGRVARMRGRRHSRARDMAAVRFHYDIGEDFFGLWLDRRLTYSCAYFPDGTAPDGAAGLLDEAQEEKLDLVARKLRVSSGTRLLDIGCGWGSLIARAAERSGCQAVGITLSERQARYAGDRIRDQGLEARVHAEVRDYRDLGPLGRFDAVASIGMFEHVGRADLPAYFGAAFAALRPGGLFLNHGIASGAGRGHSLRPGIRPGASHFVDRYVFPDGELVPIEHAIHVARRAGFEVLDVQSLRPHYALTLAAWVRRLEDHWTEAVAAAGEEVARTWRLYMTAARLGFERGDLDVCQMLLARPDDDGPTRLPLRPWW